MGSLTSLKFNTTFKTKTCEGKVLRSNTIGRRLETSAEKPAPKGMSFKCSWWQKQKGHISNETNIRRNYINCWVIKHCKYLYLFNGIAVNTFKVLYYILVIIQSRNWPTASIKENWVFQALQPCAFYLTPLPCYCSRKKVTTHTA